MSAIDILAFAAWPLIIVGLVVGRFVKRRRDAGKAPHQIYGLVAILLIVIPAIALMVLSDQAASLLFSQHLVLLAIGGLMLWSVWKRYDRLRFGYVFGCFVAFACIAYAGWNLIGDYFIRPRLVEAIVANVDQYNLSSTGRSNIRYYIALGGNSYRTTYDIYSKVKAGERIRAEVGRGSGMILAVEPLPF